MTDHELAPDEIRALVEKCGGRLVLPGPMTEAEMKSLLEALAAMPIPPVAYLEWDATPRWYCDEHGEVPGPLSCSGLPHEYDNPAPGAAP